MLIKASFRILYAIPLAAWLAISPAAATTYVYTGLDFTTTSSPYTTSDKVTGSVTFSSPLADSTNYNYNTPGPPTPPLSWSFSDGIQTISGGGANPGNVTDWTLVTNASGSIVSWELYVLGLNGSYININNYFGNQYDVAGCVDVNNCDDGQGNNLEAGVDNAGSWGLQTSATPLPAALPLFATGLGALGVFGWRRKRKVRAIVA
jgi:hypothetical protein